MKRCPDFFNYSATVRLIILFVLFSLLGAGVMLYIIAYEQKTDLAGQAVKLSSASSDLIKRSVRFQMLARNPEAIQHTIENLSGSDNIKRIRIVDGKWKIAYSSRPEEINTFLGTAPCAGCHAGQGRHQEGLPEKRSWRIHKEAGAYMNLIFHDPVYNEPPCYTASCHFHPKGQGILGLVEIDFPLSHINSEPTTKLLTLAQSPVALFWMIFLFAGLFLFVFVNRRQINQTKAMPGAEVGSGRDLSANPAAEVGLIPSSIPSGSEKMLGSAGSRDSIVGEGKEGTGKAASIVNMAFDSIRDPFIILDRDYRIVKANEAYAEMRCIPLNELINAKCHEVLYGNHGRCNECVIEKTFRSGDPCSKDKLIKFKSGGEAWFEIYTYPIHDEHGNVSHVIEYLRDITDRKRTEKTLKSDYLELEQIFDGAADAMCVIDEKFTILRVNAMFLALVGRTRENTIGQRCCDVFPGPECGSPNCCLIKMLQDPGRIIHFESKRSLEDGKGAHFIITATAFRGPDGELIGIVEDFKDISERKERENKLRSLSLQDELTGLCNRRGFLTLAGQELKIANRLKRHVCLLYADLDGLKNINDSLGHEEGDRALKEAASVLKSTFRTSDIIARIGGDEFVVMPAATDAEDVGIATARLRENIAMCNRKSGRKYNISLSTGVAFYDPEYPCSVNELLLKADTLMYEEKRRRKR